MFKKKSCFTLIILLCMACTSRETTASEFEVTDRQEMTDLMLRLRATQFLQRTTFGPKESEVDELAARMSEIGIRKAAEEWIDRQLAIPPTRQVDVIKRMIADDGYPVNPSVRVTDVRRYREHAWWDTAIEAPDQLKQRIAWALSQIFVVNDDLFQFHQKYLDVNGTARWMAVPNYYDMFLDATDSTYRDLLGKVTFSPVMGLFLNHYRNAKGDPDKGKFADENFAREILQLFSIGRFKLRRDGTFHNGNDGQPKLNYSNDRIQEFARLFTGFEFQQHSEADSRGSLMLPMRVIASRHDSGEKRLLSGLVLPAGMNPIDEINAGLDNIAEHHNVGVFIGRLLIQRLVSSNPSRKYIYKVGQVFNDNGHGVRGDMTAVIKEVLLNREAWGSVSIRSHHRPLRLIVRNDSRHRERMNEPILGALSLIRRYGSSDYPTGQFMLSNVGALQQAPYKNPTVFNFYLPDFQASGVIADTTPGGHIANKKLVSPELQLMHSDGIVGLFNWFHDTIQDGGRTYYVDEKADSSSGKRKMELTLDFSAEEVLADDPAALAQYLDLTLCSGKMSPEARKILAHAISNCQHPNQDTQRTNRARGALMAVYTSPAFWITD